MNYSVDQFPVGIEACDCLTAFGDAELTAQALLEGRSALEFSPVLGCDGGDLVPLALTGPMDETLSPRWLLQLRLLAAKIPSSKWGTPRTPVIVTSSNFGVGSLYAFMRAQELRHLAHGTPFSSVELLSKEFDWGEQVHVFSHACITAHLGLAQAARLLQADLADRVLVFSFDFISPFVAGGFHSLKILNNKLPAPYAVRETGSIGLGDGAAFAVLTRASARFQLSAQVFHNEMYQFTGNKPDSSGFAVCPAAIASVAGERKLWIKGHGTGTLESGRLEAEVFAHHFPKSPLVSWKGGLGHTLGSCGLVELAITLAALRGGRIPGTVGTQYPCFTDTVAVEPLSSGDYDGTLLASNAFGGAHAALLLTYD